ncbi:nuclear transport factor 2 family protein [Sinomonas sp. ASV322]|uniref:nuclear transport factor 2 family protein n=1 Tax=Sinomonas sp. ASV322 TaxID=3041920 RepID=UPI0027DD6629|nr:nuclear transport factor 2 family protein [Sinomonas sp. ASV322]MDQ4501353.1 nuclear transport factor 2 family protein [Sinomonas sp. ASV322]
MDASGIELLPDGPVRRMVDAANRHDLDAMLAEFADDYENVTPNHPARSFTGSAQVRKNWESLFAGVPDLRVTVHAATTAPDGTVWMEWSNEGTRRDGVAVQMTGVSLFAVRDNLLAAVRFYVEPVDQGSGDVDDAIRAASGASTGGQR